MKMLGMVLVAGAVMAGCASPSFLDHRTTPERAVYSDDPIDLRTLPPAFPGVPEVAETAPMPQGEPGNWTYTTPTTVTRDEHKAGDIDEVSFYIGRPAPGALPFLVISTTHNRATRAEHDVAFKIQQNREYSMNGNIVREWTGITATGSGFSELLVRRPGDSGDATQVCHAIALVRSEDEQKLALSILSTITWTPAH